MKFQIIHMDALEAMRGMADNSVSLICTDPPYYRVKSAEWDRQWDSPESYISWIGELCIEWRRVLKPNGSIYVFASPDMAARVEVKMRAYFNVLNQIRWIKGAGWHQKTDKEAIRCYLSNHEQIIFAEHYSADSLEPLRAWFVGEKERLGLSNEEVNRLLGTATNGSGMAGHYFKPRGAVQWELPTPTHYTRLQTTGGFQRTYESVKQEYEELRRPFFLSADVPYTDVWTFPTVGAYQGKHECEKPLEMLEHIVRTSSREGDTVLDCFAGSFSTGVAAKKLNRNFIGIEKDEWWCARGKALLNNEFTPSIAAPKPVRVERDLPLFREAGQGVEIERGDVMSAASGL